MPTIITSLQNAHVKEVAKLAKRSQRDRRRLTVVEGEREIGRALAAGIIPVAAYICPDLLSYKHEDNTPTLVVEQLQHLERTHDTAVYAVSPEVYAKLAYRSNSGGIVLVVPYLQQDLDALPERSPCFYAVIEGVEKPGNLGAILRTADAAGVDGVVVCSGATDIHNPNVVRASLGTLFTVPLAEAATEKSINWLRKRRARIIAATPDAPGRYTYANMRGPIAIVLGSEATGLSNKWLAAADEHVSIPMHGVADSLNLAISTALLLYEVVRQRDPSPLHT